MVEMIISALSGLGMFLFGMLYMEHALKEAAGMRFKRLIKNSTDTIPKAVLAGAGATALLQSSSVVTLMTLSFVSASLISMSSGIGVIFGSNIGTTATAWIVATLGFKIKIELFALPMVGLGGLGLILFEERPKIAAMFKVFIGFGLLFLGLDFMKSSIDTFASQFDISAYTLYPVYVFVGLGFLITAIIQSSSASTAIVLSALAAGILNFENAAAMVVGANIGTTVTALLGAIGGIPDKKRVALAHFVFNAITALLALLLLPWLIDLLDRFIGLEKDPTTALALFHTIFNLLGVLVLTPLIPQLANQLQKLFVVKAPIPTRYIHLVDTKMPDAAFVAARNELSSLFSRALKFSLLLANIRPTDLLSGKKNDQEIIAGNSEVIEFDYERFYQSIKDTEIALIDFVTRLSQESLSEEQGQSIEPLFSGVRECIYAAKLFRDIKRNVDEFMQHDSEFVINHFADIRINYLKFLRVILGYVDGKTTREEAEKLFDQVYAENRQILKTLTNAFHQFRLEQRVVTSMLNTNRTVMTGASSFWDASSAVAIRYPIESD